MRYAPLFTKLTSFLILTSFQMFMSHLLWAEELEQCKNMFPNLPLSIHQPNELQRGSGKFRRWLGKKFFTIDKMSLSELAEDMYLNKGLYDLVFKGDKGLFTDLGIFDLLQKSSDVITIRANSTKTFHIVGLPSGGFVIYLQNQASYGEELSFVASQKKTGALLNWFQTKTLNSLLHTPALPATPLELDLGLDNLITYTNPGVLPALRRLSKMYELMGNRDLTLAVELSSYQNQLKYMSQEKNYSESQVLETYKKAKKLFGLFGEESAIQAVTFFSLLSEVDIEVAYHIFEQSGGLLSNISDHLAIFMGLSYELKMKRISGEIPKGEVSSETLRALLEEHKNIYSKASNPYVYLASVIGGKKEVRKTWEEFKKDYKYIRKHAKADHDGPLLILAATSKNSTLEQVVAQFNQLYALTKDGDISLTLLTAVELDNYSMEDVTAFTSEPLLKEKKLTLKKLPSFCYPA